MTEKERTLQMGDDGNFRRLGVNVNDEEFRRDYFRYRDLFGIFVGNGNLPASTILEIALRHLPVSSEKAEAKAEEKAEESVKRPVGRPRKNEPVAA